MTARDRLHELARTWRVIPGEPFETESSVVAYGLRGEEPVVLKVVKAPGDEWRSGEVASAFAGRGMVRVLEWVEGAVLLERIVPGGALVELSRRSRDDDVTEIIANLIGEMSPGTAPAWCPNARDWGRAFTRYVDLGDTRIPPEMVARARATYAELCQTEGPARLLHGDLQHYNILEDRERGWVAIDPKGVVGEVEFEVGAALRNPVECPDVFTRPAVIERRVAVFAARLGLDATRVLRWAFAQGVLSAIWGVEDGYVVDADNPTLTLARAIDAML
jgi:streptomycin 6-kinase